MVNLLDRDTSPRNDLTLIARYSSKAIGNYKENVLPSILKKHMDKIDSRWFRIIEDYKKIKFKDTSAYFFTSFVPYDLHIGSKYNSIYNINDAGIVFISESVILAILDEWRLIPVESVSRGHRCICMIDFPNGIPDLIKKMKEVEKVTNMNQNFKLCLCNL